MRRTDGERRTRAAHALVGGAILFSFPSLALGDTATAGPAPASASPQRAPKTAARAQPAQPARAQQAVPASRAWHTVAPGRGPTLDEAGRPKLVLQGLNIPDRVEIVARSDRGGFSAEDLDRAAREMREPHTGNEHPIHPRLLDLVYRVQVHFKAPEVRIISGYRTPKHGATSNHGKGRAMALVVPGASDEDVARFAREQGFVGVGVYPVSGFVHLDVRERSFFWVDTSGPGKRSRLRGILADVAQKSDREAIARGERSVGPFQIGGDVDAAVLAGGSTSHADDDDDDSDAAM